MTPTLKSTAPAGRPFFALSPKEWIAAGALLLIHALLQTGGWRVLDLREHWQMAPYFFFTHDPGQWSEQFHYNHGNPPGQVFIFSLFRLISGGHALWVFALVLPLLHVLSYLFFSRSIRQFLKPGPAFAFSAVLLFNPYIFLYHYYPFYCTFLFCTGAALLYALIVVRGYGRQLLWLATLFAINGFFRATWQLPLIGLLLLPFLVRALRRQHYAAVAVALLLQLVPAATYVKNYLLFGKFTASTWLGLNLQRLHIDPGTDPYKINFLDFYAPNCNAKLDSVLPPGPLTQRFAHVPFLNQCHSLNIRSIEYSDAYMKLAKEQLTPMGMVRTALPWGFIYFESPANYFVFKYPHYVQPGYDPGGFKLDYFDLPGIRGFELSWYLVAYPLAFLFCLYLAVRRRNWVLGYLLVIVGILSALYWGLDPFESQRMRFEIEPIWWFFCLQAGLFVYQQIERFLPSRARF